MGAQLVIDRGVITLIYHAEKSGRDYLTIMDGESTFNLSSGDLDLSKTPTLTPGKIEAEVKGFLFGKNQLLSCQKFKFTPAPGNNS